VSGPTRRSTKGGWTAEEVLISLVMSCPSYINVSLKPFFHLMQDQILTNAVKKYQGRNWKRIGK